MPDEWDIAANLYEQGRKRNATLAPRVTTPAAAPQSDEWAAAAAAYRRERSSPSSQASQVSRRPGGTAPAREAARGTLRPRRPSPPSQPAQPTAQTWAQNPWSTQAYRQSSQPRERAEVMQVGTVTHRASRVSTETRVPTKRRTNRTTLDTDIARLEARDPVGGTLARIAYDTVRTMGFGELSAEGVIAKLGAGATGKITQALIRRGLSAAAARMGADILVNEAIAAPTIAKQAAKGDVKAAAAGLVAGAALPAALHGGAAATRAVVRGAGKVLGKVRPTKGVVPDASLQAGGVQEAVPQVVRPGAGGQARAGGGGGQDAGGQLGQTAEQGQVPVTAAAGQAPAPEGTPQVAGAPPGATHRQQTGRNVRWLKQEGERFRVVGADGKPGPLLRADIQKKYPPVAVEPPPPQTTTRTVRLQRYEEAGQEPGGVDKPHGLYTSPGDIASPHADLGGAHRTFEMNPDAKVLDITPYPGKEMAVRRGADDAGAGVHAVRHLLGEAEWARLRQMKRAELQAWAESAYPGPDYARYYDRQEILEAVGAQEARRQGYDAIHVPDPLTPEFAETVLLTERAARETTPAAATPVPPTVPPVPPVEGAVVTPAPDMPPNDVTGVAKAVTQRPPQPGLSKEEALKQGQDAIARGVDPMRVAQETLASGKPMSDEHLSAVGVQLRTIRNQRNELFRQADAARKAGDVATLKDAQDALDAYDAQTKTLLDAADLTTNRGFHRTGMAAQIVLDRDYVLADLPRRADVALMGQPAPAGMKEKLRAFETKNATLQEDLTKAQDDLAQAYSKIEKLEAQTAQAPVPASRQARQRARDVDLLKQFFGEKAGLVPPGAPPGSKMGRTQGAVNVKYTIPDTERRAMQAVRRMAKEIAPTIQGQNKLPQLLDELRVRIGVAVPDKQLLRLLSDKYRNYLLESDINRMRADKYLRDIQRAAQYRMKPKVQQAAAVVMDVFNTAQRSLRAGLDISAPFIQGRKGITADPGGWIKSWVPMMEAIVKGEAVPERQLAAIRAHPMYARAVAAGLELAEAGGSFTAQEEMFAGNTLRLLDHWLTTPQKNKAAEAQRLALQPLRVYLQGLEHSEAAYTAFLNGIRWDMFVKQARLAPNDPAYLRDTAATINTIFGRGASPTARAVGRNALAGNVVFAPRYTVAQWEYASLRPIRKAETALGRKQALKVYAWQAALYGSLVAAARLTGVKVDTDWRSSDFGKVEMGGTKADLFGKEAQAYRFVAQMLYGSISETGKYTPPSGYNAYGTIGRYVGGKSAPGFGNVWEQTYGQLSQKADRSGWQVKPKELKDYPKDFLPLWVSQSMEDGTFERLPTLGLLPAKLAGEDIKPGKLSDTEEPMSWKPGIYTPKRPSQSTRSRSTSTRSTR